MKTPLYAGYLNKFITLDLLSESTLVPASALLDQICEFAPLALHHIRSRLLGALRMMLSTRSRSSAASEAEETTARLSL